jgi:hypothetical protein
MFWNSVALVIRAVPTRWRRLTRTRRRSLGHLLSRRQFRATSRLPRHSVATSRRCSRHPPAEVSTEPPHRRLGFRRSLAWLGAEFDRGAGGKIAGAGTTGNLSGSVRPWRSSGSRTATAKACRRTMSRHTCGSTLLQPRRDRLRPNTARYRRHGRSLTKPQPGGELRPAWRRVRCQP